MSSVHTEDLASNLPKVEQISGCFVVCCHMRFEPCHRGEDDDIFLHKMKTMLKMRRFSETLESLYKAARCYNPEQQ
jgi:hypothetical protein